MQQIPVENNAMRKKPAQLVVVKSLGKRKTVVCPGWTRSAVFDVHCERQEYDVNCMERSFSPHRKISQMSCSDSVAAFLTSEETHSN